MSEQYPGGFINKTAPTLNPALGNAAPGVWNMTQVQQAIKAGTWPAYDPYYKNVVLNLHGDGTNGAQNNTFLDSSTNNFTITRNGNTTQGTFTPYGSNWSNYFNGSSYLTVPSSSAFKPASSDFTIEAWVFVSNTGVLQTVYGDCDSGTNNGMCELSVSSTLKVEVDYFTSSTAVVTKLTTGSIQANAWNHICVSKTGTTMYIGYNGTLETFTGVPSTMQSPATLYPALGRLGAYAGYYITGYISNFRFVVGSAVYTGSTYTVPISPLTAISGTSLLTCQSNRFIDNSSNSFAITTGGSPSVQRFSPFSPTTAYSTSVIGGSGYFDGSGDYLRVAYNSNLYPTSSGTDYTVECWLYPTAGTTGLQYILGTNNTTVADWGFTQDAGQWGFTLSGTGGNAGTVIANQWTHIAMTRNGSTVNGYVNGVRVLSVASSTQSNNGLPMNIGMRNGSDRPFTGYISDVRIVNGTAVYTGTSYTVPTAPLTAISNTQFLGNYTNAGILDNAMMNDLETVGNAQISTSVKKYGTGSMYFDGTGDYLTSRSSVLYSFTGDNTIECWIYASVLTGTTAYGVCGTHNGVSDSRTQLYVYGTGKIAIGKVGVNEIASATGVITTSTWYHVAAVRNGTTTTIYVNGSSVASSTTDVWSTSSDPFSVGYMNPSNGTTWNGYIDDLRITKGYARYTASFTPPTSQLQDQ